jgi:hypothetical protein
VLDDQAAEAQRVIVSLTSMSRPLLVAVDPAGAKLRMVE